MFGNLKIVSISDIKTIRAKHRKTLSRIFENPVRPDIIWSDIESLLAARGGEISEGQGIKRQCLVSNLRISLRKNFHRRSSSYGGQVG